MSILEVTLRNPFILSMLRENTPLDTKRAAPFRASISATQVLLAEVDAKIQDTENALAVLRNQRDAALQMLAIPTAVLAPVRRLPSEILGEIFQQCVPIKPTHVTPFDSRDAPLLLTHVCHRWRRVAQGTPLLWSKLVVHGRTPEAFFSSIWLNNSGSVPLDIVVTRHPRDPDSQSSQELKHVGDPIDPEYPGHGWRMDRHMVWLWPKDVSHQNSQMVVEQLPRLRTLDLICEASELRGYFPKEAVATIPSLQVLSVKSTCIWNVDPTPYLSHNISTPRLHTLVLNGGAEFLLPALECSNLRKLVMTGNCTVDMFVDFVSKCPALEFIEAVKLGVKTPRESMDMSPIILPGVLELCLGSSYEYSNLFNGGVPLDFEGWIRRTKPLERLRTPNLESLEIRYLPHCGHILSNCMADSHSALATLSISEMRLTPTLLGDAMFIFSAIEDIDIYSCHFLPGFWESLTPAEDTPSHLWTFPKLKGLVFDEVDTAPEHEAEFARFVERRAPPIRSKEQSPPEGICYLEEIELIQSSFSEETLSVLERLKEGREDFDILTQDCRRPQNSSEAVQ